MSKRNDAWAKALRVAVTAMRDSHPQICPVLTLVMSRAECTPTVAETTAQIAGLMPGRFPTGVSAMVVAGPPAWRVFLTLRGHMAQGLNVVNTALWLR